MGIQVLRTQPARSDAALEKCSAPLLSYPEEMSHSSSKPRQLSVFGLCVYVRVCTCVCARALSLSTVQATAYKMFFARRRKERFLLRGSISAQLEPNRNRHRRTVWSWPFPLPTGHTFLRRRGHHAGHRSGRQEVVSNGLGAQQYFGHHLKSLHPSDFWL